MLNNNENEVITYSDNNIKKFNIVLCEIFNDKIHGSNTNSIYKTMEGQYLNLYTFKWSCVIDDDDVNINNLNYVGEIINLYNRNNRNMKRMRKEYYNYITKHRIIRNYKNIMESGNYINPEIAHCIYLEEGLCICIIKTHWIKLIQRCWRRVLNERKIILMERQKISSIFYKELRGKWPKSCNILPGLKNLLKLKNVYKNIE